MTIPRTLPSQLSKMWNAAVRENLGFIVAFAAFILFRRRKHLMHMLNRILNFVMTRFHRTFSAPTIYSSPATIISASNPHTSYSRTTHDSKYPNSVLHFRKRFFGSEYFVVESAYVANTLAEHGEYFENVSFTNRIFRLCRRSNPAQRFEHVPRAPNNNLTSSDNVKQAPTVGECKTNSSSRVAAADEAYQKFAALETDTKNGGHPSSRGELRGASSIESIVPGLRSCVKELVVLLEAKANRRSDIDIREYTYKHAVNILGVCLFGHTIEELTSTGCHFYARVDELRDMWLRSEREITEPFLNALLKRFDNAATSRQTAEVVHFFRSTVVECMNKKNGNKCLMRSLIEKSKRTDESSANIVESLSEFVMAFSIYTIEVLAGAISIILHELAQDADLQEKIRDKDKVKFNLEGLPYINVDFLTESLYINSLIKETFKTFPIDPLIQLSCKRVYRIPNTSFQINPKSVVLIPVSVLQTDNNLYPSMNSSNLIVNQEMEKEYAFITDSQMQSFFVFVNQFVDICLKTTLTSVIQMYEFETDVKLNYEYGTSCRFTTLPNILLLRPSKIEKRGKTAALEESLKAFHASQDVPFLSKIGL